MSEGERENLEPKHESTENVSRGKFTEVSFSLDKGGDTATRISEIVRQHPATITFIQDIHIDSRIRQIVSDNEAAQLKELGVTHYLIEAPTTSQALLDQLNSGTSVDLYKKHHLGPRSFKDRSFADAIYAMADHEIKVKAIDHPDNYDPHKDLSREDREAFIYAQIKEIIDSGGKAVVLIGQHHAEDDDLSSGCPSVAKRIVDQGHDVTSIKFDVLEQKRQHDPLTRDKAIPHRLIGNVQAILASKNG